MATELEVQGQGKLSLLERPRPLPVQARDVADNDRKAAEAGPNDREGSGDRRGGLLRQLRFAAMLGVASAATSGPGYLYWEHTRHFESTDDAFIAARQFPIAPKVVSGYLTKVPVTDNQHVSAGDVIAHIDDRDYRVALQQAQAQVAAAQASIENIDAQLAVQQAQIEANQAQLEQVQAALVFSQQQATRYQSLARTGAGTVENAQQYASQLKQQQQRFRPPRRRSG